MWKLLIFSILISWSVLLVDSLSRDDAENRVTFTLFDQLGNAGKIWKLNQPYNELCNDTSKVTFIVHGWRGSRSSWIHELKDKFLKYRGGCVVIFNWGFYAEDLNYVQVVTEFFEVMSDLLLMRLQLLENSGFNMTNMMLYGHSVGGHICINAALKLGKRKIGMIDACDIAGPLFNIFEMTHDPKEAASNVQCIHTSIDAGTSARNCHQDFVMGNCGVSQPASEQTLPLFLLSLVDDALHIPQSLRTTNKMSHEICNDYYVNSFEHDFIANNKMSCGNVVDVSKLPSNFKMGFMEERRNSSIVGIIPCPTSTSQPYN